MIKKSELRIGNLAEYNSEYYKFESIEDVPYVANPRTGIDKIKQIYLTDFNPIPLTSEILERCGFVKDDIIQQDYSYVLNLKVRLSIVYYMGDASCLSVIQDAKMIDFASGVCKYLHQLQNLYHALTGTELEIKELQHA